MTNAKDLAVRAAMKDVIEQLIAKYDGSITEAARSLGTSHQNLRNWQNMEIKAKDVKKFLDVADRIFDVLKIPPSKRWAKMRGKK